MKQHLRGIIFIAALFLIPAASWTLDLKPRIAKQEQLEAEITQQSAKLQNVKNLRSRIEDLNKEISDIEAVIEHFQQRLPEETEIETVLKEVWRIAKANELQANKVSTLKILSNKRFTDTTSPYCEQVVLLQITGDFRGFYSFMTALERLPRLMRVREMVISENKNLPSGHITSLVELSVFYEL